MLTLHPPAFIETESCDGPRYTRGQPSRETIGVTMTEIQDKYIPEFELPYRNIKRYIKEIVNNWDRLDEDQRNSIRESFNEMKINHNIIEKFSNEETSPDNLDNSVRYVLKEHDNIKKLLNTVWKPTEEQKEKYNITEEQLRNTKDKLYSWSIENTFVFHSNWKSGLASFLVIILVLFIGIMIGSVSS